MYDEIRASVDLCHRDGTLKRAVAEDPGKFIHADAALVPMLRALRASGKKIFLLTNSLWDFTNVVMNFLVSQKAGDDKGTAFPVTQIPDDCFISQLVTVCPCIAIYSNQKGLLTSADCQE